MGPDTERAVGDRLLHFPTGDPPRLSLQALEARIADHVVHLANRVC